VKREIIHVPDIPQPLAHYVPAVRVGDFVFAAGQIASDYRTGVPPEARADPAFPYHGQTIKRQARYILANLQKTFQAAGTDLAHVVKAQVFLTDLAPFAAFDEVWREFFPVPPPRTGLGIAGLLVPGTRVEIDLTAVLPSARPAAVSVPDIPQPLAHYVPAVRAGDLVFAAGQIASDYRTGVPPEARSDPAFPYYSSEIQRQARYVLENLRRTFRAAGTELQHVVKSQVFLTDLDDFFLFDQVWRECFPSPPPRTTVGISGLLVPGTRVEIDLIAAMPSLERQVISVPDIPQPLAHYVPAVRAGDFVFAAGQIASDYRTGVPPEARADPAFPYYSSEIQRQARYILENLRKTFRAAGTDFEHVVKSQVFLTDLDDFFAFDQVWREFFPSPPPRTTVQVSGLLVPGCRVEIDLTAVVP
jgi:enamine deaminase RidA (YjgF/YER057c/UK114 family)